MSVCEAVALKLSQVSTGLTRKGWICRAAAVIQAAPVFRIELQQELRARAPGGDLFDLIKPFVHRPSDIVGSFSRLNPVDVSPLAPLPGGQQIEEPSVSSLRASSSAPSVGAIKYSAAAALRGSAEREAVRLVSKDHPWVAALTSARGVSRT